MNAFLLYGKSNLDWNLKFNFLGGRGAVWARKQIRNLILPSHFQSWSAKLYPFTFARIKFSAKLAKLVALGKP